MRRSLKKKTPGMHERKNGEEEQKSRTTGRANWEKDQRRRKSGRNEDVSGADEEDKDDPETMGGQGLEMKRRPGRRKNEETKETERGENR